jgi:N utilization substance protein B
MGKFSFHKRSIARLAAVQSLYQFALLKEDTSHVLIETSKHFEKEFLKELGAKKYDKDFFEFLVTGVLEGTKDIDHMIEKALPENWAFPRIDLVLLCILRAGVFELWKNLEADSAVIINEYLNTTHAFYGDKEPGFVNGVLHAVSTHLRPKQV